MAACDGATDSAWLGAADRPDAATAVGRDSVEGTEIDDGVGATERSQPTSEMLTMRPRHEMVREIDMAG